MRSVLLGLAALVTCLTVSVGGAALAQPKPKAGAAPANAQANLDKGMQMAPALIASAKVPCTPTAANFLFTGQAQSAGKQITADFVEVACENDLGYIFAGQKDGAGTTAYDCITTSAQVEGKDHPLKCTLPGNATPARTLQAVVDKAGYTCAIDNGRAVGATDTAIYYELSCREADGLFIGLDQPRTDQKALVATCYQRLTSSNPCTLTTKEQSLAPIMALAAKAEKPCAATEQRYVGRTESGAVFYEFACPDGAGFIAEAKSNGEFTRSIPCAEATGLAGGCTLTEVTEPTAEARTEDNILYSGLAKKAGFNCDVSKYGIFPRRDTDPVGIEVIEMACSNRPDGAVGYFGDTNTVVSCLQGRAQGYRCSYTDEKLGYPLLTAALKAKGRSTCTVSDARPVGVSPEEDFVEVACSDGLPGWVLAFTTKTSTVTDALTCAQAEGIAGGCQLASNKKK